MLRNRNLKIFVVVGNDLSSCFAAIKKNVSLFFGGSESLNEKERKSFDHRLPNEVNCFGSSRNIFSRQPMKCKLHFYFFFRHQFLTDFDQFTGNYEGNLIIILF